MKIKNIRILNTSQVRQVSKPSSGSCQRRTGNYAPRIQRFLSVSEQPGGFRHSNEDVHLVGSPDLGRFVCCSGARILQLGYNFFKIIDLFFFSDEFHRAVKICTGNSLSRHLVHTVFAIFDEDGDGHLSYREFIAIMKERLHRGFKVRLPM